MTFANINEAYFGEPELERPRGYAARLAGYIGDASTIRVRCIEKFTASRCPSVEEIERMVEKRKRHDEVVSRGGSYYEDYSKATPQRWTTDEAENLKLLWTSGKTSNELAAMLGRTRGSILGKLHHMGLTGSGRYD